MIANRAKKAKKFVLLGIAIVSIFSAALLAFLINVHKTQADASTCYWVGDTSPANWNDASHWSSSSGGSGSTCDGGVVPGSDDIVVFDSANTNGVTLDISPTVTSIINTGNYSGEFNMNGSNLTVAGDFTFKGGSILAGAGALGVGGDFDINGTTYTYNTQAVTLTGVSSNIDAGGNTLYDLVVDGGLTIVNSDMSVSHGLNVSGTLTINSGRKLTALNSVTTTVSGTIDGDGLLELVKYAWNNLGSGGTVNVDIKVILQDNPNDNSLLARTLGGDLEFYNGTATTQRVSINGENGVFVLGGNLTINQETSTIHFGVSGWLDEFHVMGDFAFIGVPWGNISVSNPWTGSVPRVWPDTVLRFSGNLDMGYNTWGGVGSAGYDHTNVIFDGDNTSYHHGVYYTVGLGAVQTFYDLTIEGSNVAFYDTDRKPFPDLADPWMQQRQGLRVMHDLTIEDGASLVIMNNTSNLEESPYHLYFEDKWYNDEWTYGSVVIEHNDLNDGDDGKLVINGTGTITGEGYLHFRYAYPNFSETDGTIDVPVLFESYEPMNIVGRTFNKDIAFTHYGERSSTWNFGTAHGQTFNILGDLIVDSQGTKAIHNIDASVYNPDINISGNYFNDSGGNIGLSYITTTKMGSGTWRVGGNFDSLKMNNQLLGEDATLELYGDEKRLYVSTFYNANPYHHKAQGIGDLIIDNSVNPSNQIYIDSYITVTNHFLLPDTSNCKLRYGVIKMWDGSTTDINGYLEGETEYLELFDDSVLNFNYSEGHVNVPLRIIPYTKDISVPARYYDMDTEIVNLSAVARTATLGTAAGQSLSFDNLHLAVSASASVSGGGGAIILDASTHNPTINIISNLDVRESTTINQTFVMGNSTWNVGGSINFNNAIVERGTSTINLTGSGEPQWQGLAVGQPTIYAQETYNEELYVGGNFSNIGGVANTGYIAKWDGSEWSSVGGGCNQRVRTMYVYQDELYVGGSFTSCGGVAVRYIAKWNGSEWSSVGPGLNSTPMSMTLYGSSLAVGGWFTETDGGGVAMNYIGLWDGLTWSPLGAGINNDDWGSPTTMLEYDNKLYVGGDFYTDDEIENDYFAIFDGSNWSYPGVFDRRVDALYEYNQNLLIGGYFKKLNNLDCELTAFFDGSNYSCMGSTPGLSNQDNEDDYWYFYVEDFQVFENELYVGGWFKDWTGSFNNYFGGAPSTNLAKWDGVNWVASGTNNISEVNELDIFNDDLVSTGVSSWEYMLNSTINRLSLNSYMISNQGGYPATKNQLYNLKVSSPSTTKVIFSDSTEISNIFYNHAADSRMEFNSGDYFHFPHLDIDGAPTPRILWRSTNDGQAHYLIQDDLCPLVYYVDVKDSDASLGDTIFSPTSVDSGSNPNWDFVNTCEGSPPDDPGGDEEDDEGDEQDEEGSVDEDQDNGDNQDEETTSLIDNILSSLPISGANLLILSLSVLLVSSAAMILIKRVSRSR